MMYTSIMSQLSSRLDVRVKQALDDQTHLFRQTDMVQAAILDFLRKPFAEQASLIDSTERKLADPSFKVESLTASS